MTIRKTVFCSVFAFLIFISLPAISAQAISAQAPDKPKITLDEFFNYVEFTDVKLSPDGHSIVIGTDRADWDQNIFREDLWLYRDDNGGAGSLIQVTNSGRDSKPQWSPDGRWIAFLSCTWSDRGVIGGKCTPLPGRPTRKISTLPRGRPGPRQRRRHTKKIGRTSANIVRQNVETRSSV